MKPIGKWYNFAFVARWVLFLVLGLFTFGKPRTVWFIYIILDICLLVFSILCLKTFMNFAGILIIVEEVLVLIWHIIVELFFISAPENSYEEGTVKFLSYIMLFCFLLCLLIEIILLFLGGRMCFKSNMNSGHVGPKASSKKTNSGNTHFKVELPDSAKA